MFDDYNILKKLQKNIAYSSKEATAYLQSMSQRKICGKCVRLRLEFFALLNKIEKTPDGKFIIRD